MRKTFLVILSYLMLGPQLSAQNVSTLRHHVFNNGWDIREDDTIELLKPKGSSFLSVADRKSPSKNTKMLPANFANRPYEIVSIEKYAWDDGRTQYFGKIKAGGDKYFIDLERAIYEDEIKLPVNFFKDARYVPYRSEIVTEDEMQRLENRIDSIPLKDGTIFYDRIVEMPGKTKDEIFVLLRNLFVESFKDSKYVLEVNDMPNGRLTGKATFHYAASRGMTSLDGYVTFVVSMAIKDGKFRYQLYNFTAEGKRNQYIILSADPVTTKENFPMESALNSYRSNIKKEKLLAKQQLINLVLSVDIFQFAIKKVTLDDSNDISKF